MNNAPPTTIYDLRIHHRIHITPALSIVKTWSNIYTLPPILTKSECDRGDLVDVWVATRTRKKKDDTHNNTR